MGVSGVGGPRRDFEVEPAAGEVEAEAPRAAAAPARARAVAAAGPALPRAAESAVLAFDARTHPHRNVPDRSYGGVLDARRNGAEAWTDGSWTVRVASFPTTIAGPQPGAKPSDIATYLWKNGKVTALKDKDAGALAAQNIEEALRKASTMRPPYAAWAYATSEAIYAGRGLFQGGLYPDTNPSPDKGDVARFKATLAKLEKDGKLDDLRRAAEETQRRELQRFGGSRPRDWYGSFDIMATLVDAFGTAKQKRSWGPG